MNIRFNDKAAEALKEYTAGKENKAIRLKVMSRG